MIKITNLTGNGQRHDVKYERESPLRCEVSTHWLGVENPGMNVGIYSPDYASRDGRMIACVYPGGKFEFSFCEHWGD